jgi:hypothetical protein
LSSSAQATVTSTLGGDNAHDCRVVDIGAIGDIGEAFAMDVPSPDNLADRVGVVDELLVATLCGRSIYRRCVPIPD